jgi:hypothetical protein
VVLPNAHDLKQLRRESVRQKRQAEEKRQQNLKKACQDPFDFQYRYHGQEMKGSSYFGLYPKGWKNASLEQKIAWWKNTVDKLFGFSASDPNWELLGVQVRCY